MDNDKAPTLTTKLQGVTLVYGKQRRNFPCPLWHDIVIANWYLGFEGRYEAQLWPSWRIRAWDERKRDWDRFQILTRFRFSRLVLRHLVSAGLVSNPGPRQNIQFWDCTADTFEIVQCEGLLGSNLHALTGGTMPISIGEPPVLA